MRRVRSGREDEVKAIVFNGFTKNMGAVDHADRYCASYTFNRKNLRCLMKIFLVTGSVCRDLFRLVQDSKKPTRTQAVDIQEKPHLMIC